MAHLDPKSLFTSWVLTELEQSIGYQLNGYQKMVIQNEIAIAATEKVALKFDPNNPMEFCQREAELAGKIGMLQFLLAQSEMFTPNTESEN